ncbi:hypothetical protein TcasGA2_TC012584 [Tribolium castaneum]|uniref:Uncharacterized protein n=1 Tax=Tribolium castaneum TaxID=7070 RepID=D6X3B8_TRICA|nr:hypothetical protein TcasGA2_TC012584 [Tribolium castaneum]
MARIRRNDIVLSCRKKTGCCDLAPAINQGGYGKTRGNEPPEKPVTAPGGRDIFRRWANLAASPSLIQFTKTDAANSPNAGLLLEGVKRQISTRRPFPVGIITANA